MAISKERRKNTKTLEELFVITYPRTLVFGHQILDLEGIPFVTSSATNNGIAGYVRRIESATLFRAGSITVPLKGSVMQAHLQPRPFYCAHQIAVLSPRTLMTEGELLFYVMCLRENRFRFNYGRQADRTLKNLLVPDKQAIPKFARDKNVDLFSRADFAKLPGDTMPLRTENWAEFRLSELFEIKKGKRLTKMSRVRGNTPFIGALDNNNGFVEYVAQPAHHPAGIITVNYNGNGVAEAFYQPQPFRCSDDVHALYPKFALSEPVALFITTVIRQEKYRFNYGRKWHLERMKRAKIRLPVDPAGEPDLNFMSDYICRLPFSASLEGNSRATWGKS